MPDEVQQEEQEISPTSTVEEVTKKSFRKKIWAHIMKNELTNFPFKVYRRIPNFKSAGEAAERLLELDEFKAAKVIKINLDKPQEPVRLLALEANKEILVPIPRLKSGLFLHVAPGADTSKEELKNIASPQGILQHGKPLGLDSDIKVDLLILGAVCVSREGHRIGKGEGFADLEYAIMRRLGAVDDNTTIITTVHDCQIVDDLPATLFEKYDVPVDIIVTPTQTIYVKERLKKPDGVFWEILTPRRVKSMQILQQLYESDEKEGKPVAMKDDDSNDESKPKRRPWKRRETSTKRRPRVKRETTDGETDGEQDTGRGRYPRRRKSRGSKNPSDRELSANDENADEGKKDKRRRRKLVKSRQKPNIDFSLKLSNIKSHVRVRHLKNALLERGVRATNITWHGQRGFCYLHFGKLQNDSTKPDQPIQVDSIVANLQQLRLSKSELPGPPADDDEYIIVEPAKPITRIEITDVTAV